MRNEIKAQIKAHLEKTYSPEIVKKALGRGESYLKSAFGTASREGYQCKLEEDGMKNLIAFFGCYASEVAAGENVETFNRKQTGIYRTCKS